MPYSIQNTTHPSNERVSRWGLNALGRKQFIMSSQATEHLEVLVTEPGQLHKALDDAEAKLRQVAISLRSAGILVTRHDPGRYTLALSDTVPFGETWEQSLS
jgi:hypothetical protein